MKLRFIGILAFAALLGSCGNGDTAEETSDTANTLNDTFPSGGRVDSVALDSNPPDNTKVDSLATY